MLRILSTALKTFYRIEWKWQQPGECIRFQLFVVGGGGGARLQEAEEFSLCVGKSFRTGEIFLQFSRATTTTINTCKKTNYYYKANIAIVDHQFC